MRHATILFLAPAMTFSVLGCGGGDSGGGTTTQNEVCSGATAVLHEANDYAFTSTLTFPPVKVAPNSELTFDWGMVTKDMIGHTVDPKKDLNSILITMWKLSLEDLQTKLNADNIAQSDLDVLPLSFTTDGSATTAKTYAFTLNGQTVTQADIMPYFDPTTYPPDKHTYTLLAAKGTTLGQGTQMIQSFQLDKTSTNTTVSMKSDSTRLTYTANLHKLTPVWITAGKAAVTLDWGQMTTNALGNTFISTNITDALVANYTQTPTELESKFLDLDLIANKLYRAAIPSGTVVDFTTLKNDAGQPFSGIDATGTWIVALRCGGCRNPAPWFLSVLKPCTK